MVQYGHFPFRELREQQEYFIDEYNLHKDSKYVIGNLPTGAGKSPLAISLCNAFDSGYVLTATKALQDQYERDFKNQSFTSVKGKNNYPCTLAPNLTADNGRCLTKRGLKSKCMQKKECPYYEKVQEAMGSKIFTTSYAYFFAFTRVQQALPPRDIMIFDEAHLLENELVSIAAVDLNIKALDESFNFLDMVNDMKDNIIINNVPSEHQIEDLKIWIATVAKYIIRAWDKADKEYKDFMESGDTDSANDAFELSRKLSDYAFKLKKWFQSQNQEWIYEVKDNTVQIRPLDVSWLFKSQIEPFAKKFVFLSATIFDQLAYTRIIGIDPIETAYIRCDSTFDPKKSPIVLTQNCKTDYSSLQNDSNMKQIAQTVSDILAMHKSDKGIIHTGNMSISKYLKNEINSPRLLVRMNEDTNDRILEDHKALVGPTVLVSSSMTEGVDLAGNLSRFQIIIKSPFLSLGDKRVKRKSELDSDWYQLKMLEKLVQACGRSTRSEEDSSRTYILDSKAKYWLDRFKKKDWIPKDFLERIIVI